MIDELGYVVDNLEAKFLLLTSSAGSGSKLLHSLLDSHPDLIMIPGYPFMYLYPFLESFRFPIVSVDDLEQLIESFSHQFRPFFDTRTWPGSEGLNRLGTNRETYLEIDENKFSRILFSILLHNKSSEWTKLDFVVAIHLAYNQIKDMKPIDSSIIIYHIHEDLFADLLPYGLSRICMSRTIHANFSRRIKNSFEKANETKLSNSDCILAELVGPSAVAQLLYYAERSIRRVTGRIVFVSHESLNTEREKAMSKLASLLGIRFNSTLLMPTFGGHEWKTGFYKWKGSELGLPNPEIAESVEHYKRSFIGRYDATRLGYVYFSHYQRHGFKLPETMSDLSNLATWKRIMACIVPASYDFEKLGSLLCNFNCFIKVVRKESKSFADSEVYPYPNNLFYSKKVMNKCLRHTSYSLLIRLGMLLRRRKKRTSLIRVLYIVDRALQYMWTLLSIPFWSTRRIYYEVRYVLLTRKDTALAKEQEFSSGL